MTYSIIAYDPEKDAMGIGVVSGSIAVGSRVPWLRYSVGGVATQAYTNPSLGPIILGFLEKGYSAKKALDEAISRDPGSRMRQVAVMKWGGIEKAFYNGADIPYEYSGYVDDYCVSIANLVVSREIPKILCRTFNQLRHAGLGEALLEALREAHLAGGDKRGDLSGALVIVGKTGYGIYYDKIIDIRVDYSRNPIESLINIYRLMRVRL